MKCICGHSIYGSINCQCPKCGWVNNPKPKMKIEPKFHEYDDEQYQLRTRFQLDFYKLAVKP